EYHDARRVEAVGRRRRGILLQRRVGLRGARAGQRHGRQPLRLLPARRRTRVHRLRRPHRRPAHPARPALVRPARSSLCSQFT
uniref:Uncharacterized protein n=1 Tax=Aegilops tauschii subsp. strangulata TaxID=200361 RepID=A0A453JU80_AEGTS